MKDCIFCKIGKKELPADIIYEDDKIVAFKDIHPKAPIHYLIIPKEHIVRIKEFPAGFEELIGYMILTSRKIAAQQGFADGYKIVINVGREGGPVDHLHIHVLCGDYSRMKEL